MPDPIVFEIDAPGPVDVTIPPGHSVDVEVHPPAVTEVIVAPGLPGGSGLGYQPYTHLQEIPQATVDITHNLARPGPVAVSFYSLDGAIEYYNVTVQALNDNTIRVSFDDPTAFVATVF
ncbi:hypothetical protein [Mycolicibacter arupensis]|uniref:Uncharacterized protein n=1 Tax=Mycolicibacter arupensis TaxID=342002 RepID=A0A5C7XYF6_9MYCO|nr:hypothetical protein [Mycolicibacter arupensis]MCV7277104.1 hypothetical protein [Mycolicibacter arupensis]OQZ93668.1 hypothetical protein BST15_17500 [Mycolicibacter arupensis]TXI54430.1 MAG: hypothetical protein E6Q54_14600 [Mycolicibacter arupensis]